MQNKTLIFLLFIGLSVQAQIATWSEYKGDSVRLLWMPARVPVWKQANTSGYILERVETANKTKRVVLSDKIMPLPYENWKPTSKDEAYAKAAIYDQDLIVNQKLNDKSEQDLANSQGLNQFLAMQVMFESHAFAIKMGLGFVDRKIEKNKTYSYRLITKGDLKDTAYFTVSTNQFNKTPKPPKLKVESKEKAVVVSWPAKNLTKSYAKYYVERSVDGKNWSKTSKEPLTYASTFNELFILDSLHINYRPVAYRLLGMTFFGEWLTSDFITTGFGRDYTPPNQPVILSASHKKGKEVEIKWTQKVEGDLRGFYIARSNSLSGNYGKLNLIAPLSKTTLNFTDRNAELEGTNHYMVIAVDTAGNERASLPAYVTMIDTIPPLPPVEVIAKTDEKGHVKISWAANKESDLKGYYVYFANDPTHEFSQITKTLCTETSFADTITLNSLTQKVYYKVIAMDTHFQKSDFSAAAIVARPDIIKPAAVVIESVNLKDSVATITWQNSPSPDVASYKVFRKQKNTEWNEVHQTKNASTLTFTDKQLNAAQNYEYAIVTIDQNGNASPYSESKFAFVPAKTIKVSAANLKVNYDKEKKENILEWRKDPKIAKAIIYRSTGKEDKFRIVGFASTNRYVDHNLASGTYTYKIQPIMASGIYGGFSNEETVKSR